MPKWILEGISKIPGRISGRTPGGISKVIVEEISKENLKGMLESS